MSESLYWTWLSQRLGAASPYLTSLIIKYPSPKQIFDAEYREIMSLEKIPDTVKARLNDKSLDRAEKIIADCKSLGIGILTYNDPRYPRILKYIDKPPAVLYFLGQPVDFDKNLCVAMVGTREMSDYGRDMAYRFGYELASAGAVIISGMALGVDGMSLAGALDAQAHTVAVLGCGVDVVYPKAHGKLYNSILKDGFIISEYPPGAEPDARNFPQRNRIISGLSRCTLVVECPKQSGALITARNALAQGRPVFSIPGCIGMEMSEGTNHLIQSGARIATCSQDIITMFDADVFKDVDVCAIGDRHYDAQKAANRYGVSSKKSPNKLIRRITGRRTADDMPDAIEASALGMEKEIKQAKEFVSLSKPEKAVYDCIPEDGSVSIDLIVNSSGESVADVSMHLLSLSIKGVVIQLPGNRYRRA